MQLHWKKFNSVICLYSESGARLGGSIDTRDLSYWIEGEGWHEKPEHVADLDELEAYVISVVRIR